MIKRNVAEHSMPMKRGVLAATPGRMSVQKIDARENLTRGHDVHSVGDFVAPRP
jgi:hypothetical protein